MRRFEQFTLEELKVIKEGLSRVVYFELGQSLIKEVEEEIEVKTFLNKKKSEYSSPTNEELGILGE